MTKSWGQTLLLLWQSLWARWEVSMTKWNWAVGKEGGISPAPEDQLDQLQTWFSNSDSHQNHLEAWL